MLRKIFRCISYLLVMITICNFVFSDQVHASQPHDVQVREIKGSYEAAYVLSKVAKDQRYREQRSFFRTKNISLKRQIKSILKFPDHSYKIVYVISNNETFYELIYYMDSSFHVLLQDMKENILFANSSMEINWSLDNEKILQALVHKNGTFEVDGRVYTIVDECVNSFKSVNGGQTRNACEVAMSILCGAGGGAGCYAICGIEAVVTRIGALGCAVACGLIGSLGCYAATKKICG